ncbi:MAG: hypothetical protein H6Q60_1078 [Oscillospiraceae bacterium]|nr:hypothetical protein [Oscillospiraceae bacterium]
MAELVVFYSHVGEICICGDIKNIELGITETAAGILKELTGADSFKIETAIPAPKDFSGFINQAMTDLQRNARPELVQYPERLDDYAVIYLGYPNYFKTMPVAVYSFLERTKLSGKKIRVFCTHGGDGFGHSIQEIEKLCPEAVIEVGPAIRDSEISNAESVLKEWVRQRKENQ